MTLLLTFGAHLETAPHPKYSQRASTCERTALRARGRRTRAQRQVDRAKLTRQREAFKLKRGGPLQEDALAPHIKLRHGAGQPR